ncbi:reverse transcriptase zinc-binding domain-containing protein [Artemisia annua]|uniref:Reverse transcriptase zinc-binding domain-containing protein n=1 Tax=Artemisia annua TaxID=35608 RepID=A0A2U1Q6J4_ARTAN|nr:reverse transcriptase zinc-binding domain-containing protein [Artemisia annua]
MGKGGQTSAWFDKWHDEGPLDLVISRREIDKGGFDANSKVKDLLHVNIDAEDKVWWKDVDGNLRSFDVSHVLQAIRPRYNFIDWFDVVWFSQSIHVWLKARGFILIPNVGSSWSSFVASIKSTAHKCLARVVVAKIIFGATIYYIWKQRNNKLFNKKSRQVDQVFDIVFSTTRLKIMTLKFKNSAYVARRRHE